MTGKGRNMGDEEISIIIGDHLVNMPLTDREQLAKFVGKLSNKGRYLFYRALRKIVKKEGFYSVDKEIAGE